MTDALRDRIKAHRSAPDVYDPPTFEQMADRIEELEAKLVKAEWLLVDAAVQLEEGKIKTRRNRAALIQQFLAELTGGKDG